MIIRDEKFLKLLDLHTKGFEKQNRINKELIKRIKELEKEGVEKQK